MTRFTEQEKEVIEFARLCTSRLYDITQFFASDIIHNRSTYLSKASWSIYFTTIHNNKEVGFWAETDGITPEIRYSRWSSDTVSGLVRIKQLDEYLNAELSDTKTQRCGGVKESA